MACSLLFCPFFFFSFLKTFFHYICQTLLSVHPYLCLNRKACTAKLAFDSGQHTSPFLRSAEKSIGVVEDQMFGGVNSLWSVLASSYEDSSYLWWFFWNSSNMCMSPRPPPPKKRYSVNVDFLWLQEPDMLLKALWDVSFGWWWNEGHSNSSFSIFLNRHLFLFSPASQRYCLRFPVSLCIFVFIQSVTVYCLYQLCQAQCCRLTV